MARFACASSPACTISIFSLHSKDIHARSAAATSAVMGLKNSSNDPAFLIKGCTVCFVDLVSDRPVEDAVGKLDGMDGIPGGLVAVGKCSAGTMITGKKMPPSPGRIPNV